MLIFRNFKMNDPAQAKSLLLRKDHEYKWLNLYSMNEQDFTFKFHDEIELYVSTNLFNKGNFHEVYLSLQRRKFHKVGQLDDII